ncbi:hypothetical protein DBA29_17330 [Xenophilus aerolatus]|nr:hypothetical protein [Xenophilus aerolatus]
MENEDDDPVGPAPAPADPIGVYTELAVQTGLVRPGDKLDQNLIDFAAALVDRCARVGDRYGDGEAGGNAGEHIRAEYLP